MSNKKMTTVTLKLHGHFAGKTVKLNGVQFRDGKCKLIGPTDEVENLMLYLGRSYQALPEVEVKVYGSGSSQTIVQPGDSEAVPTDLLPEGEESAESETLELGGYDDPDTDNGRRVSSRSGHEHSRISTEELFAGSAQGTIDPVRLRKVLEGLSSKDDSAWTQLGYAKLDKVCASYGSEGVTRRDVEAVWPEFTRKLKSEME